MGGGGLDPVAPVLPGRASLVNPNGSSTVLARRGRSSTSDVLAPNGQSTLSLALLGLRPKS